MKPLLLALLLAGAVRASTNEPTVINSDRMQSDYVNNVGTGKKITIWHGKEKMDVESDVTDTNRTRLIIYPEEQRKKAE